VKAVSIYWVKTDQFAQNLPGSSLSGSTHQKRDKFFQIYVDFELFPSSPSPITDSSITNVSRLPDAQAVKLGLFVPHA
jgi:hypothetical protein